MLFKEMADRSRRGDMVNAAKNVCLDQEPCPSWPIVLI